MRVKFQQLFKDGTWNLLKLFYDAEMKIIFSTARNEKCREETENKLWSQHGIIYEDLYMRKEGDRRPASEVKKEHLQEISKNYNIILFIDDDLENCEMTKALGIQSLRKV